MAFPGARVVAILKYSHPPSGCLVCRVFSAHFNIATTERRVLSSMMNAWKNINFYLCRCLSVMRGTRGNVDGIVMHSNIHGSEAGALAHFPRGGSRELLWVD